jgi:hypothetical protein
MLVLSSTVASRYYNWCTDGSTSPGNYGYPVVRTCTHTRPAISIANSEIWNLSSVTIIYILPWLLPLSDSTLKSTQIVTWVNNHPIQEGDSEASTEYPAVYRTILNVGIHWKSFQDLRPKVSDFQTLLLLQMVINFGRLLRGHPGHWPYSEIYINHLEGIFAVACCLVTSWSCQTTGNCEDTCQMICLPDS